MWEMVRYTAIGDKYLIPTLGSSGLFSPVIVKTFIYFFSSNPINYPLSASWGEGMKKRSRFALGFSSV